MRSQLCSYLLALAFLPSIMTGAAAQTGAIAGPAGTATPEFQKELKAAYASWQARDMTVAATRLERLQVQQPGSFAVHELLGLVYAALAQPVRALEELQVAVNLQPSSADARNNLATAMARNGDFPSAKAEWQHVLVLQPEDYTANRDLARFYLKQGDVSAAVAYLDAAHRAKPDAADTTYDLALADLLTGKLVNSRTLAVTLVQQQNSGEAHGLLGRLDEQEAKYVDAANEFATAAHLDPSEDNLFVWASELLLHRAYPSAIEVFRNGTERYPASPRLWVGLGMALYSRGEYEPSIHSLLTAADLNAEDPRCYLFLSKAYLSSPSQAEQVIERFQKYATLQPSNALAQFYYALSLWKGKRADSAAVDYAAVETLLLRSIALDETNAEAHLQLGILYHEEHLYDKAQPQYVRALQLNSNLADAHFRLGRSYLRAGEKDKAQVELDRFKSLQAQHQAQVDKERAEVQQFVIATQTAQPKLPHPDGLTQP